MGKSITRARGRGLGPGNRDFLGCVNTLGMLLTKRSTFTKRTKIRICIHISTSIHTANKRTEGGHPGHAAHKVKYVHKKGQKVGFVYIFRPAYTLQTRGLRVDSGHPGHAAHKAKYVHSKRRPDELRSE